MPPLIEPLDPVWLQRAAQHQLRLTAPAGALGRLLDLGQQICAIQRTLQPLGEPATVLVMAADHGIAEEGVSAYRQEVTGQMVANFLAGGAAINVLARRQQAPVLVVDMGIKHPPRVDPARRQADFVSDKSIGPGTANFLHQPAMMREQALQALHVGRQIVSDKLVPGNVRVLALGEMGIGNSTSASALAAALLGLSAAPVTGRGTGVSARGWHRKIAIIDQALSRHFPDRNGPVDGLEALIHVGGFEIAGLVGAALEAAARRMLVILDGLISTVAGLVAARLEPAVRSYFVASHASVEIGHRVVLQALGLVPLLDLGLRLGEGSGAALALNLVQCAADLLRDMATFDTAGVSNQPG